MAVEPSAQAGWNTLRTVPYSKPDLHEELFNELWQVWPEPLRSEAEAASTPLRRKMSFSRYGLIEDPLQPNGPPMGVVADNDGGWAMSCLACHQGKVAGRVIPGLPNSHFAFQTLVDDVNKAQQRNNLPSNPLSRAMPLGRSNGTTNAQIFSVFLSALRDKELNVLKVPKLPKFAHHDLDAPPLWHTARKKQLYIDGFVPKTHRVIMQFALVPTNDRQSFIQREDAFRDILYWIESLQPPSYPWPIDDQLALSGQEVFNRSCANCHGTYGADGQYPELMVSIDEVGTDSLRLTGMPAQHRRFYRESWFGDFGKLDVVEEPEGYVAPPLDGLWATAPYFHNGSVPTLWHVLTPSERPKIWIRTEDGYDQQRVGLEISSLDQMPTEITRLDQKRSYFDTSLPSKSAGGHDFAEHLSESEREQLLEYLKTL